MEAGASSLPEAVEAARWTDLDRLLLRDGALTGPGFEAGPDVKELLQNQIRVLVVGAGGLGCELLKDLGAPSPPPPAPAPTRDPATSRRRRRRRLSCCSAPSRAPHARPGAALQRSPA